MEENTAASHAWQQASFSLCQLDKKKKNPKKAPLPNEHKKPIFERKHWSCQCHCPWGLFCDPYWQTRMPFALRDVLHLIWGKRRRIYGLGSKGGETKSVLWQRMTAFQQSWCIFRWGIFPRTKGFITQESCCLTCSNTILKVSLISRKTKTLSRMVSERWVSL